MAPSPAVRSARRKRPQFRVNAGLAQLSQTLCQGCAFGELPLGNFGRLTVEPRNWQNAPLRKDPKDIFGGELCSLPPPSGQWARLGYDRTIFDLLEESGVSWK